MEPTIEFSPSFSMLTLQLSPGESVKAEPGAMAAQQDVDMKTGMSGGLFGGFKRMLTSESFFLNTFTAGPAGGWVSLAPPTPGDILSHDVRPGQELFIQSSSFLACSENVQTDAKFQGFKGLFSGESLFFLRIYTEGGGSGTVYFNSYGAIKKLTVTVGKELVVDTGHVVAFTNDVEYSIGKVGGLGSLIAGGEGLVMKFKGNGHVWVQTRTLSALADKIVPFLPSPKGQ